jgi:glycosyltransferase involved in cell wall biosynthesis
MKVMMLGWELPPHNSGGLGVACRQLAQALHHSGADIDFILPYRADHKFDFMRVHAAVDVEPSVYSMTGVYDSRYYLNQDGHLQLGLHDQQLMYDENVARLAEKLDFDIIHAHDWLTFRAALRARQVKRRPLILHVHSIERDRAGGKSGNPFVREIEENAMLGADLVYAVSERTRQMIIQDYHIPADKIDVAHNSIDTLMYDQLTDENEYRYLTELKKDGWKVVANVGRMTIQKGLPHLLDAAKRVVEYQPRTLFLLVGDGEQRDELIELAAARGISRNVIFAGFQRGARWRDAYAIADLFVMPSVSEPFGLTPLEAAFHGTPSLISWQSGVSELFKNSLKVDYWDVNLMADKIIGALRSEAFINELGNNAQTEVNFYSWRPTADKIFSRYQSFAGSRA